MKKVNKPVKAYKGFNKHMQCTLNGKIFQYEIGKEYKEDKADLCHTLYGVSYDPKLCCGKEDDAFYIGTHFIDLYRDYLLLE